MSEYALILVLVLLVTVFFHRKYKVKLFKSKRHILVAYAIIIFVGVIWDHIAIYRGHWSFGKKFLLGPHIGLMPIEEFSFGIIMPYFGLVIYKIAEKYLS